MKLILLGAPGAGKGTQSEILSRELGIPTISTGNILRAAIKDSTPVGLVAKSYMDEGKLVPDEIIIEIIHERVAAEDCAKVAFDLGLRKVKAYVKGPGNGRESAIRTVHGAGIEVTEIVDVTPLPHNGCRPPKRRRV